MRESELAERVKDERGGRRMPKPLQAKQTWIVSPMFRSPSAGIPSASRWSLEVASPLCGKKLTAFALCPSPPALSTNGVRQACRFAMSGPSLKVTKFMGLGVFFCLFCELKKMAR